MWRLRQAHSGEQRCGHRPRLRGGMFQNGAWQGEDDWHVSCAAACTVPATKHRLLAAFWGTERRFSDTRQHKRQRSDVVFSRGSTPARRLLGYVRMDHQRRALTPQRRRLLRCQRCGVVGRHPGACTPMRRALAANVGSAGREKSRRTVTILGPSRQMYSVARGVHFAFSHGRRRERR